MSFGSDSQKLSARNAIDFITFKLDHRIPIFPDDLLCFYFCWPVQDKKSHVNVQMQISLS